MANENELWGVHMGAHVGDAPIEQGYIGIGWKDVGDLSRFKDREAVKTAIQQAYPDKKSRAIPLDAGTLWRFSHEMKVGELVIYPSKQDRMVNLGRIRGDYFYHPEIADDEYPNRRPVEWIAHFPRDTFSQSALYEIGSFISLFRVRAYADEFLRALGRKDGDPTAPATRLDPDETRDDEAVSAEATKQAEETTGDFVIRRLMTGITGHDFEEFVANLMEAMGYTARVTPKSADGGVDVIAHKDTLGFEPPIIKIQCKRMTSQAGEPEVNQLLGTLGEGEFGLFVTLGSYSKPARLLERNRAKLRLIDGDELVGLIFDHYQNLAPRWRNVLPLRQIYVADLAP